MTLPAVLFAVRWLVRDTLRQARASGVTAAMLVATTVCFLLCLSVTVTGDRPEIRLRPGEPRNFLPSREAAKHSSSDLEDVDVPSGEMTLLFGAVRVPLKRTRTAEVRFLETVLAGGVTDTLGVLLALVWTAGFLPAFLDPAAASMLFAKPVPRWAVLAGKFGGVLFLVAAQAILFVAAVWAALGARTGVWDLRVFAAVPVLVVHFGGFYAVSVALAVTTRSTLASVLGTVAIWLGCWAVNYARQAESAGVLIEAAYWLVPKPVDFGLLLVDVLGARDYFGTLSMHRAASGVSPEAVIATSCLLPSMAFLFAAWRLSRSDY